MTELIDQITLPSGLSLSRIVTGLWQMADQERDGKAFDLDAAAEALADYAREGFTTFDMADHYGSAEIVAGKAAKILADTGGPRPTILTKWCPEPGPMDAGTVRKGVETALERLAMDRVDVMQFHWWQYQSPEYLDALTELMKLRDEGLVGHIGLTNFDAAHLRMVLKQGIEIATNQVCFSVVDRRAAGALTQVARENGVGLLGFGTLCGGFLADRWVGQPAPATIEDWSRMKYMRFVETAGGWDRFQGLLTALSEVGRKHGVSVSNVASRWVLEQGATAGVIVGARLGENAHRDDNRRMMSFALDAEDKEAIAAAELDPIPGDCGDEYRKPPFLTASGDLSHHLGALPPVMQTAETRPGRTRAESGSIWEEKAGFARAVRKGKRILVSGTTATDPHGQSVCKGDAAGQAVYILDKITGALTSLGGSLEDVLRTRIYLTREADWQAVSEVHARYFGDIRPANTLIVVKELIGGYEVEIEAEAELD